MPGAGFPILVATSWDHVAAADAFQTSGTQWLAAAAPASVPGWLGYSGLALQGFNAARFKLPAAAVAGIVSVRFRLGQASALQEIVALGLLSGAGGVRLRVNAAGRLRVTVGATDYDAAGPVLAPGVWHRAELAVSCSATAGAVTVLLDGLSPPAIAKVGIPTGGASFDALWLGDYWNSAPNATLTLDDLIVRTDTVPFTTADLWTDPVGNPWLTTLYPAGDGAYGGWEPAGAGAYAQLNELLADSAATALHGKAAGSAIGDRQSWTIGAMPGHAVAVRGVVTDFWLSGNGGAAQTVKHFVRIGGTDYDHALVSAAALPAGWQAEERAWPTNPASAAAWLPAEVSGLEVGVIKETTGDGAPAISQAVALVVYVAVPPPAYPTFDLVSEEPRTRVSARAAHVAGGPIGAVFAQQHDKRAVRTFSVVLKAGRPAEMARLRDLWAQTRFGALPMRYNSPDDGPVLVVFDDPELTWRQLSGQTAAVTVRLKEVLGL